MSTDTTIPELKQILGALIFATRHPLTLADMRKTLVEVAKVQGGHTTAFASVKEADIADALKLLQADLAESLSGFNIAEVADGLKLQSDDRCAPWVRHLLNIDKAKHLSRPSLETLAIIAYRQPITRAEIESIRGVNIDHIIAVLMEMELVRMVGRSNAPGRPMLLGTTKRFLEHFGLQSLDALPGIEELARIEKTRAEEKPAAAQEESVNEAPVEAAQTSEVPDDP